MKELTNDWYNLYINKLHVAKILHSVTKEIIYYDITVPWPIFKSEEILNETIKDGNELENITDIIEKTTEAVIRIGVKTVREYETKINVGMFKDFVYKVHIKDIYYHEDSNQDILFYKEVPRNTFLNLIMLAKEYDRQNNNTNWNFHLKKENLGI